MSPWWDVPADAFRLEPLPLHEHAEALMSEGHCPMCTGRLDATGVCREHVDEFGRPRWQMTGPLFTVSRVLVY